MSEPMQIVLEVHDASEPPDTDREVTALFGDDFSAPAHRRRGEWLDREGYRFPLSPTAWCEKVDLSQAQPAAPRRGGKGWITEEDEQAISRLLTIVTEENPKRSTNNFMLYQLASIIRRLVLPWRHVPPVHPPAAPREAAASGGLTSNQRWAIQEAIDSLDEAANRQCETAIRVQAELEGLLNEAASGGLSEEERDAIVWLLDISRQARANDSVICASDPFVPEVFERAEKLLSRTAPAESEKGERANDAYRVAECDFIGTAPPSTGSEAAAAQSGEGEG